MKHTLIALTVLSVLTLVAAKCNEDVQSPPQASGGGGVTAGAGGETPVATAGQAGQR